MLDTGFPWADAENDFLRARRRHTLAVLGRRLRLAPRDTDRIVALDEAVAPSGRRGVRHVGLQTIPLRSIIGTVDPRRDFDRSFRPTTNRIRHHWERLARAHRRGEAIPPIEVYRVGELYFVNDGHHRVSVAAASGAELIDAYVTDVLTAGAATATCSDRAA